MAESGPTSERDAALRADTAGCNAFGLGTAFPTAIGFLATAFFATVFLVGGFLATVFFAAGFFAAALLATVFFTAVFFTTDLVATALLIEAFFGAPFFTTDFFAPTFAGAALVKPFFGSACLAADAVLAVLPVALLTVCLEAAVFFAAVDAFAGFRVAIAHDLRWVYTANR